MTRHQRRKAGKAKWEAKATALVQAHKAWERTNIVSSNLSSPHRPKGSEKGTGNLSAYSGRNGPVAVGQGVTHGKAKTARPMKDGMFSAVHNAGATVDGKALREAGLDTLRASVDKARKSR